MKHEVKIQDVIQYNETGRFYKIKCQLDGHVAYISVASTYINEQVQEGTTYTTEDFNKFCPDGEQVEIADGKEYSATIETGNELDKFVKGLGYDSEYEHAMLDIRHGAFINLICDNDIDL